MKPLHLILVSIALILVLERAKAQTVDLRIDRLYQEQFDHFYKSESEKVLFSFDSIVFLTSNLRSESIKMAIQSCEDLLMSGKSTISKEVLEFRKAYLTALLNADISQATSPKTQVNSSIEESTYRKIYDANTFHQKGYKYIRNNQKYRMNELKVELLRFEESRLEYERYRKNVKLGTLIFTGTIVSYATALMLVNQHPNLAGGVVLFGFTCNLASIPFMVQSTNHWNKAVWNYNRDIVAEKLRE